MANNETEPSPLPIDKVFEWYSKRGVHSGFKDDATGRMSRIEFGSLTDEPPALIVQTGVEHFVSRPATPEEGKSFLEAVKTALPDTSLMPDLAAAVERLEQRKSA